MTKILILIGKTGSGKSTLANVISGTNNFMESGSSSSATKNIQSEEFKNIGYHIIDTVGIGDTKLKKEEVLDKIAEAVYLARGGISKILFVTDGRFDPFEMSIYDLLRTIIFDEHAINYTTITRTNFDGFKSDKKRKNDISLMVEKGGRLAEVIKSCQEKVVHVSNPPIEIEGADEDELEMNKEDRDESRKILLEHLQKECQDVPYMPQKLRELGAEIIEFIEGKIELEKKLKNLEKKENRAINDQSIIAVEGDKNESENIYLESYETRSTFKNGGVQTDSELAIITESKVTINNVKVDEIIAQLEDEKAKLKKQIQEKEELIRQKVLKHIFNNFDGITKEMGGNTFLGTVTEDDNDWTNINQVFADKKLVLEWRSNGFGYQEVQKWFKALGDSFDPKRDAGFCTWLRDTTKLSTATQFLNYAIDRLKMEYCCQTKEETDKLKIIDDWQNQQLNLEKNGQNEKRYDELKKFLKEVLISLSWEAKKELVSNLKREIKRRESVSDFGNTKATIESVKEIKEELENSILSYSKEETGEKSSNRGHIKFIDDIGNSSEDEIAESESEAQENVKIKRRLKRYHRNSGSKEESKDESRERNLTDLTPVHDLVLKNIESAKSLFAQYGDYYKKHKDAETDNESQTEDKSSKQYRKLRRSGANTSFDKAQEHIEEVLKNGGSIHDDPLLSQIVKTPSSTKTESYIDQMWANNKNEKRRSSSVSFSEIQTIEIPQWEESDPPQSSNRRGSNSSRSVSFSDPPISPNSSSSEDSDSQQPIARMMHQIQSDIAVKEQLVNQLEHAEQEFTYMRSEYEQRLRDMQENLIGLQRERDIAVKRIQSMNVFDRLSKEHTQTSSAKIVSRKNSPNKHNEILRDGSSSKKQQKQTHHQFQTHQEIPPKGNN